MFSGTKKSQPPLVNRADLISVYRKALLSGVPIDTLDKKIHELWQKSQVTTQRETSADLQWQERIWQALPNLVRLGAAVVPVLLIAGGVGLLSSALWPIAQYYLQTVPTLQVAQLDSPIPPEKVLDVSPLVLDQTTIEGEVAGDMTGEGNDLEPIVVDAKLDYTNLQNWFSDGALPSLKKPVEDNSGITEYRLDIPKIEITNAVVAVGGDDLNKNLIQYDGTALPGRSGAPVIFGHSVLRQFYNPKETNPRRYTSIFSKIMTLQKGDRIYLTVNGAQYTYIVEEKTEVKPTDTYILAQRYDVKQLKLVTCVPEGTYLRRGVVTARLLTHN